MKHLFLIVGSRPGSAQGSTPQCGPGVLPLQGRLDDSRANRGPDGAASIQLQTYAEAIGGNVLWVGEAHRIAANGGLPNVLVASKSPSARNRSANSSGLSFDDTVRREIVADTQCPNGGLSGQTAAAATPRLRHQPTSRVVLAADSAKGRSLRGFGWIVLLGDNCQMEGKMSGAASANNGVATAQTSPRNISDLEISLDVPGNLVRGGAITMRPSNLEVFPACCPLRYRRNQTSSVSSTFVVRERTSDQMHQPAGTATHTHADVIGEHTLTGNEGLARAHKAPGTHSGAISAGVLRHLRTRPKYSGNVSCTKT